jgi:hypothetical protein
MRSSCQPLTAEGVDLFDGRRQSRLTYHVHILTMNGDSYRLAHSTAQRRLPAKVNQNANAEEIDPDTGEVLPAHA